MKPIQTSIKRRLLALMMFLCIQFAAQAQIGSFEYYFDTDPGFGNATPVSSGFTPGNTVSFTKSIAVTSLSTGFHTLHLRARTSAGTWGHSFPTIFYITTIGGSNLASAEYFFDTDPGPGNGHAVAINTGTSIAQTLSIPVTGLSGGFHQFYLRVKNTNGNWGHYQTRAFYITNAVTGNGNINKLEYFFDTDPGVGNATALTVTDTATAAQVISIPATGLSTGFHQLFLRARNNRGIWSHMQTRSFIVVPATTGSTKIAGAEYFIDGDPGIGNGTAIAINPPVDTAVRLVAVTVPGNLAAGVHTISIRTKNEAGLWSIYQTQPFEVNPPQPGSGRALSFDGSDDYLNVPTAGFTGIQTYTIEFWIKKNAPNTTSHVFESNSGSAPSLESNGTTALNFWVGNTSNISSGTLNQDQWYHIACSYDKVNGVQELYVNGMLAGSNNVNVNDALGANISFMARAIYTSNTRNFAGTMDELRIWNKALTQAEIRDRMCRKITSADPLWGSLKAYYNLDEMNALNAFSAKDTTGNMAALVNGPARILSGAPIGNASAHSYAGATSTVNLANPTRSDDLTATLTAGGADGMQVYVVTDTPNNTAGTTCLGSNNGYFGVFPVNGTNPSYDAVYNYDGAFGSALSASQLSLFSRTDNGSAGWNNAGASLDSVAHTLSVNNTPRGEYIVSNAVVTPTITISSPVTTICNGSQVTFTVSNTTNGGTVPHYQWLKNNVNVGTDSSHYSDASLANGDVVKCQLTSNSTCVTMAVVLSNAITMNVTSALTPMVTIAPLPGNTICAGTQVTYTATPANGGTSPVYQWMVNNVPMGGNANAYTSSSFQNGDVITCSITSNAVCASPATATSLADTMHVTPVVVPTIAISANPGSTICSGVGVTFTAVITNGSTTPVYQWRRNGSPVGTNAPTYTDLSNNGDAITCELTSNATCASPVNVISNTVAMTVNSSAAPTISIYTNTGTTICANTHVIFSAGISNGGASPVYQWKKNNMNVGLDQATYEDSVLANNDIITCELNSSNVCATPLTASSNNVLMTVNAYAAPAITIMSNVGDTICLGTNVTFNAVVTNGGGSPSFQWLKNGVAVGFNSASYQSNSFTDGDTVRCIVTSSFACALPATATSSAHVMKVNPLPTVNAGSDQTILQGSSVSLTATGGSNYLWSTGDTTASVIVSPTVTTDYRVSTTNGFGCSITDTVQVIVNFSNLSVAPASYNFGNIVTGNMVSANIVVTNNGTLTETITSASVPAPFSTTFTSATVTPGNNVSIPVSFAPAATLIYQNTLAISTSAGNFSVIIQGRGINAAPAWTITPVTSYVFNNVQVNDSGFHSFIINNTGNVPVTISGITSNNVVFGGTTGTNTIPVGGQVSLLAKFKPTAIASYSGILTIAASNPGLTPLALSLSGNGYVPGTPPVLQYATTPPYNGTSGIDKPVAQAGAFTYRIVYKSANNIAPQSGFPKIGIDMNADGDFIDAGEGIYSMSKVGNGNSFLSGESYTYSTTFPLGNTYGYRFFATDSLGNVATAVNTSYVSGPNVTNQSLDLSIYANDITFSNNNPAVGQQFTVSAVVHNNSPYNASNVPVRFYKDSVFLTSTIIPFIAANTTTTITQNFSFAPDGFYPIKVWIDSAQTLGENNPLNNYAIRPVIVGNFSLPGTISVTTSASTQSCPGTAVSISGIATYAGLNLVGNPPVLGATVTVQIAGGPTLTTNTVTGGYWSVYYSGFGCSTNFNYTVTITDYTLTSAATPGSFNAPCQSCGGYVYYPVSPSGAVGGSCIRENVSFNYDITLANGCNSDTAKNDTTFVYINNVLAYTHTQAVLLPCSTVQYHDAFVLAAGTQTLSFKYIYYDSLGRHETNQSHPVFVQENIPDLTLGSFSQTGSTGFQVLDFDPTCIPAGAHKVYLYDSTSGNAQVVLDSFAVAGVGALGYQTILYNNPALTMGYHYLTLITDFHNSVIERNENNNVLNALLYVPFPELTISDVVVSSPSIGGGSIVNYSATVHNSGSTAGTFKVQFLANGVPIGAKKTVAGLAGSGGSALVISDSYTVAADSCPVTIIAIVDVDAQVTELNENNNADSMHLAIDLVSGIGCNGLGSSCNPYVVVKNSLQQFASSVSNTGTRDVGEVTVRFSVNGTRIGSDHINNIPAQTGAATAVYHSFSAAGSYVINVFPDSANLVCEYNENNNTGGIYVNVVEGLPDLEILSQHISPSNLNPNPNQTISVVASVFNKGNQTAQPTKIRFYVDNVQLGTDIQLDSILAGGDTSVLATATYSSPTVGPKIIKVTADALGQIAEIRENNNEATRAIIVGGAPDLAHSIHEAITFSASHFRRNDTIAIRNYIRNYGGDQGQAWLRFTVNDSLSNTVFRDSVLFTLLSNDSMLVSKSWVVNMAGRGLVTTEILRSNPQEFNELNNTDTFSFEAGPALMPVVSTATAYLCEGQKLSIPATVVKDAQAVTYEWFHGGIPTGIAIADSFVKANVVLADSGAYTLQATDFWGTRSSGAKTIVINPVLIPGVAITAYPGTEICKGSSVKFTALPSNGGTAPVFQWKKNGNNVGTNNSIYRDSTLENSDVVSCTMISNAPCTSILPVASNVITMIVNPLSGALPPSSASQTYDVDSGMKFNYTDNVCRLIASVTTAAGTDLGPTTAATTINPAITTFVQRFTEITPTNNLPATVKLYFLQSEFNTYNSYASANGLPLLPASYNDPAVQNIVVYQYHGLPSSGTSGPGGQYNASNYSVIPTTSITKTWNSISGYWEISFPVTGFSGHFLKAESTVPLSVHLAEITASNSGNTNEVSWVTKREEASDYFELERSSNGKDYASLHGRAATGKPSTYTYTDESPVNGVNYYRLRMLDAGGRSLYSKVVTATVQASGFTMEAFPNPAKDKLTVKTQGGSEHAQIRLLDIAGSVIVTQKATGDHTVIDITQFAHGVYFLKYTDDSNSRTIRVVKE